MRINIVRTPWSVYVVLREDWPLFSRQENRRDEGFLAVKIEASLPRARDPARAVTDRLQMDWRIRARHRALIDGPSDDDSQWLRSSALHGSL